MKEPKVILQITMCKNCKKYLYANKKGPAYNKLDKYTILNIMSYI